MKMIKAVWILIRWLLQKPADLNLHGFQKRNRIRKSYVPSDCSELIRFNMVQSCDLDITILKTTVTTPRYESCHEITCFCCCI